jgi:hypothetical protein
MGLRNMGQQPTSESAASAAARLLRLAASVVESYSQRSFLPPDAHVEAALESAGTSNDGAEATFVAEAFHGCLRYNAGLLRPLLEQLYEHRRCSLLLHVSAYCSISSLYSGAC